ncbi:MAG TPA: poly-gamma-glutamate biosynthesis protein [Ruminococcaceae bacterium]|nr:poly-gamma-glutamate biosynthesis protein [Oscillospiraceae bacterium]
MSDSKKKNIISTVVPVILSVVVVISLAVSGHITKNRDELEPTVADTQAVVQQTETTPDAKVNIVAVGDNLIHNTLIAAGEQEDGTRDYNSFYEDINPYIKAADMAVIDNETLLGGSAFEYSGYPTFNTPWEVGEAAINAGFDVFTCATNHALDMQKFTGITEELKFFSNHPEVTYIGINGTEEEYNTIKYKDVNGIKFALLNYTYGTNGISLPEDKPWCVNMLEEDKVVSDIKEARENADVVIFFPHWGTENSHEVNEEQKHYVELCSQLGVDIVIGGHPHVLQPVEWVTNEETGKKMIVYYSLGNFISHQINLNQMCGGMAEITVERIDGEIQITSAKLAPVIDFYERSGNGFRFSVYRLSDYNNDLASRQAQSGATVEYFTDLSKDIINEEFLDLT